MVSKRFLLIVLAFAVLQLVASEIAAAKVDQDAKYDHDNDGHGWYDNGGGHGDHHHHEDHHHHHEGHHHHHHHGGHGGYYNGGGRGRGFCRYGCCGGERYYKGECRCCSSLAEATAYKQAYEAQTHN